MQSNDTLYIILPINNYIRFNRRRQLFWECYDRLKSLPNVDVRVVEVAFGDRVYEFALTENDIKLRTSSELWHKENSINLAIQRLPKDWRYVAWVDADIDFYNKNFAMETIQQLQHYSIVQMFTDVINLGPDQEVISKYKGFCYQYLSGKKFAVDGSYEFWHPGFAWAARRDAIDAMGGLIDYAILGSADHHMALCFVGMGDKSTPTGINKTYYNMIMNFQRRCEETIRRNIGYVKGTILHHWHGKFTNRKYKQRWAILTDNDYNPETDIKRDWQGLYTLDPYKPQLRDDIRAYFRQRNEDSIDVE